MKLNFRQGLARYQTDVLATPTFLQKSAGAGNFIDLIVAPDPTIVAFAHISSNYLFEEIRTVPHAWGPFSGTSNFYLYWDINLLTAAVTRGTTLFPPIYSGTAPNTPSIDQHWFDTTQTIMRVWNGTKWLEKIRVFAALLSSGSIIRPYPLGSQAGITGDFEGGNLVLDAYNKPLRQSDGSFVTSVTNMIIVNNAAKKVKFETEVLSGMAAEPIPKFSLVQMRQGRRMVLARSGDVMSRIAGVMIEDLHTNEVGFITTEGLVRNENWNWPESVVNRPIFCGTNGEVTTTPPHSGVCQVAGFVYDIDSVYMNIFAPVILDDLTVAPPPPVPPPALAPIADFYAPVTSGNAPLTVNFTSTTLNSPTSQEWDFTNDGVVNAVTPTTSFTYAAPGVYTVRLKAYNSFGSDEEIKMNFITVTQPPPSGSYTNLGVRLGGPSQTMQNQLFQCSITVSNDGFQMATNVVRTLTIPDLKGQQVIVSSLPPGSTITRSANRTIVTFPFISTLATGLTYGPVFFGVTAPAKSGTLTIQATVESPEVDSTLGDNTTSISIEVRP